jgi:GDP-mannose 6-dehydrogenase
MQVAILGLGYVGTVAGACLAGRGHSVVGVDVDAGKVELLNQGRPSFVEPGLPELMARTRKSGLLSASTDSATAIGECDVVLVTVGTPTGARGKPDLRAVEGVADQIGRALKTRPAERPLSVVLRSTVLPGTTRDLFIPRIEQASGFTHGTGFSCVFSPEFLREGSAVSDFDHPPQTLVGALEDSHAQAYLQLLDGIAAPSRITSLEVAELMKYACNCFHALKIAFANEIGAIAHAAGADGREAMALLCEDTVLNISKAYLRPGNAFGGSCLPKDLRGLTHLALERQLSVPLLNAVLPSNDAQIARIVDAAREAGHKSVGLVGLAFKDDTDDLRESPMVQVVRDLLLSGLDVRVHDPAVQQSDIRGKNLQFARLGIPDLEQRFVPDLAGLVQQCDTLIAARKSLAALPPAQFVGKVVIDLVGLPPLMSLPGYVNVCW